MKKSTNPTSAPVNPAADPSRPQKKPYRPPLIWEMFRMEGGFALLILFPLVVLYYLKMAYR